MIIVRDVFQIEPDKMKEAKERAKEGRALAVKLGYGMERILTDLTGEFYTLVLESRFATLAEYERALTTTLQNEEWQRFYPSFRKLMRGGRREIYSTVE